ncbi:MAG: hypothetical protein JSW00_18320 [Thermoplasmata archaeon]|nr:MAG: hypothetical protein JSW00_18320 [Thermoplasmata archaeon]
MAKKRRKVKEEEETYEFKMPEFDEEEFLRKEVRDSKILFVTFGYAVLMGVVSFGLTYADIALAALTGFIAIIFLRHIYPLIGIDTSLIENKQWAGNIIMYLFTWLAIWILLSNPPFSDFSSPTIEKDTIYFGSQGNWTKLNETNVDLLNYNVNVSINVIIVDNVEVDKDTVKITIKRKEGESFIEIQSGRMNRIEDNEFSYVLYDLRQGMHEYIISAKDINDHEASLSGRFNVY